MSTRSGDDGHVAIIGMAGRFPGADDVEALWSVIAEGRDTLARFDATEDPEPSDGGTYVRARGVLDGIEQFDAEFFGFSPAEATALDPQHRVWLEVAWEALERAGYAHERHDQIVSVFSGSFPNTYLYYHLLPDRAALEEYVRMRRPQSFALMVQSDPAYLPTRTAYKLGLRGPAVNVQTACSTSLVAVSMAVQSLLSFESDLSLAGGVCIAVPQRNGYFYQEGAIQSRDGTCRPYDASASGTVFGNGAGAVVLKRLADARRDGDPVLAVIRGAATNNDGSAKVSYTAPSVRGQAEVITTALALADVGPETIGYVEGHGTATPMGDPIEVEGLKLAFGHAPRRQSCCLGSVKGNVGHLDAAAGVAGLIRAALALRHGQLPATAHFERPNPELRLEESPFFVASRTLPWPAGPHPRRAGVSSFGIGGTNAHVILEEASGAARALPRDATALEPTTLLLSARKRAALDAYGERLANWLDAQCTGGRAPSPLAHVACALRDRRKVFSHRRAVRVSSWADACRALREPDRWDSGVAVEGKPRIVLSLPGQGSFAPGAIAPLLDHEPVLRETFERLARGASDLVGFDLLAWARDPRADAEPIRSDNAKAQLAVFCIDVALARWLEARGLRADAYLGHSLGEWVGAHLAGVLTEEDALWAVHRRGRLMQETGPGAALIVRLSAAAVAPYLAPDVTLACVNGPQLVLLSGRPEAIRACADRLAAGGAPHRVAPIDVAVHSPLMDPVVASLRAELPSRAWRPAERALLSTVTGRWLSPEESGRSEYWAAQPRSTVQFDAAVTTLLDEPCCVVVEAGMGDSLTSLVRARIKDGKRHAAVPLLGRPGEAGPWEPARLERAANELWACGVEFDVTGSLDGGPEAPILPTYPFQRQRYWREPPAACVRPEQPEAAGARGPGAPAGGAAIAARASAGSGSSIERRLAELWVRLLGAAPSSPDDDFFSLGGDSLAAVALSDEIRRAFSVEVPLGRIFALRTLGALAGAIESKKGDGSDEASAVAGAASLIPLTRHEGGAQLFCICGIQLYQGLAESIGPPHSVSAVLLPVEEKILAGSGIPSLPEMAAMYREVVTAVQPRGPYRLAGSSFGGMLAFELARQLQSRGESVDFLGILDTTLPHTIGRRERIAAHLKLAARDGLGYVLESWRKRRAVAARRRAPVGDDPGRVRMRLYTAAATSYCRDMPTFDGDAHFFRARERGAFENEAVPLDYNWPRFILGRCHVHEVAGGHLTMLGAANVPPLAAIVRAALDERILVPPGAPRALPRTT